MPAVLTSKTKIEKIHIWKYEEAQQEIEQQELDCLTLLTETVCAFSVLKSF